MLSESLSFLLFGIYGLFIIAVVLLFRGRKDGGSSDFLVMGRKLGVFNGSLSIAVSWIWAPAIFICAQKAFEQGLPGVFWFIAPNIICFFVFVPIALRMRKLLPQGYSISQIFDFKYNDKRAHIASMVVVFGYQLAAIIINCVAGASLLNILSGIDFSMGVFLMAGLALAYSLISGLRASVLSDVVQMLMILVFAGLLVPWVINASGGWETVKVGIGGFTGNFGNLFDAHVAYAFGIASTIGLICGPVADQMFSQRAFAARPDAIKRIFIFGGLIFGVVPIVLSLLGFVGAAAVQSGAIDFVAGSERAAEISQMIGPVTLATYLPQWALGLFVVMAFAGLTSTLDSAFTAIGSLSAMGMMKGDQAPDDKKVLGRARAGMILFGAIGVGIALMQPKLLWIFLICGTMVSALFFPVLMALFWKKLTAKGAFWGILGGFLFGTPLSIYANVWGNTHLVVAASVLGLLGAGVIAWIVSANSRKWKTAN